MRARAPLVLHRQLPDREWQGTSSLPPRGPRCHVASVRGKPSLGTQLPLMPPWWVGVKGPLFPQVGVDARLLSLLPALLWHTGPLGQAPAQIHVLHLPWLEEVHAHSAFAQVLSVMSQVVLHCLLSLWVAPGFPGGSAGKESACSEGDPGSIPGWRRSLGEGNNNSLQYSCLGNLIDRGAWWASVHGVTKSQTAEQLTLVGESRLWSCFSSVPVAFWGPSAPSLEHTRYKGDRGPSTAPFLRPRRPCQPAPSPPLLTVFLRIFF